jgi:hypothetical protein
LKVSLAERLWQFAPFDRSDELTINFLAARHRVTVQPIAFGRPIPIGLSGPLSSLIVRGWRRWALRTPTLPESRGILSPGRSHHSAAISPVTPDALGCGLSQTHYRRVQTIRAIAKKRAKSQGSTDRTREP